MIVSVSQVIVVVIGVLVAVLSAWGLGAPDKLIGIVRSVMERPSGMVLAVGVRVILGVALIIAATAAKFPVVFGYLGWIAIVAAAVLPFIGRQRMTRLIDWFANKSATIVRTWLVFGFLFGVFLIYAV